MADPVRFRLPFEVSREATPRNFESIQLNFERILQYLSTIVNTAPSGGTGGDGAPTDAQYILGAADGRLPDGRVVTDTADVVWDLGTAGQAKAALGERTALSVIGNPTDAAATPVDIVAATADTYLKRSGTSLVFAGITPGDIVGFDHDLLSAVHPDTIPAEPEIGAVIVGVAATPLEPSAFWLDGLPAPGIPDDLSAGSATFWLDGLPDPSADMFVEAAWKKVMPTAPNTVLGWDGSATDFIPLQNVLVGARAYRASNLTVPENVSTPVPLSTEVFNTGVWNAGTAPTRMTVQPNQGGLYLMIGQLTWGPLLGTFFTQIRLNGTTILGVGSTSPASLFNQGQQASAIMPLEPGDYVELVALWNTGGAGSHTVVGGAAETWLSMVRVA